MPPSWRRNARAVACLLLAGTTTACACGAPSLVDGGTNADASDALDATAEDASTDAACGPPAIECNQEYCRRDERLECVPGFATAQCVASYALDEGTVCLDGEGHRGVCIDPAGTEWPIPVSYCLPIESRSCDSPTAEPCSCDTSVMAGGPMELGQAGIEDAEPIVMLQLTPFVMDFAEVTVARFRVFWQSDDPTTPMDERLPSEPIVYPGGQTILPPTVLREPPFRRSVDDLYGWSTAREVPPREDTPITGVDWYTALAFCVWDGGRLPTEAEWEWAARYSPAPEGRPGRTWSWGDEPPLESCEALALWNECRFGGSSPWRPCSGPDGRVLPDNLSGNVAEWTAGAFRAYDDSCWAARDPLCVAVDPELRTVRGGSIHTLTPEGIAGAARDGRPPLDTSDDIGFRCVRAVDPADRGWQPRGP